MIENILSIKSTSTKNSTLKELNQDLNNTYSSYKSFKSIKKKELLVLILLSLRVLKRRYQIIYFSMIENVVRS